jgi:D-alanine--poly(phosphoribitol) ligase subunit 1
MAVDIGHTLWGGAADPPCLVTTIADNAVTRGAVTAVVDGEERYTYAQVFAWAGAIAGLLRERGARRGDPIAIACPRGASAVAALLAVTLGGFVYVPLDPAYPRQRLEHMVADSGARLVVCLEPPTGFRTSATPVVVPVCPAAATVDRSWLADPDPDLPVYVIYTSGSTGWPKGVVLQHSCLDNVAAWQATVSPAPDLRTAQFAPLNFDVSFQEIFGTLCGGGTLVIMPERLRREPAELIEWLTTQRVERLFLPFVALQMICAAARYGAWLDDLALVEVNVAGEQLVCTEDVRAFFRALPACLLVNHYGQSESAMVSAHVLGHDPDRWPVLPPIGLPLPGCELLVDTAAGETPDVGELLVAGLPVSLGYLGRPELNSQRYIDIAPTSHGHVRAFRTGDLVRLSDDGVRYLSRIDDDVKIRGARVSLGEVDAQLTAQPEITAAASLVVQHGTGSRSLHAGVVVDQDHVWDEEDVLRRLRAVLPEASVPASIVVLGALPRAPSGKLDRQAVEKLVVAAASGGGE